MARSLGEFRIVSRSRCISPAATSAGVFDEPCLLRRFRGWLPRGRHRPYQPHRTACTARCSSARVRTGGCSRGSSRPTSKEAEQGVSSNPFPLGCWAFSGIGLGLRFGVNGLSRSPAARVLDPHSQLINLISSRDHFQRGSRPTFQGAASSVTGRDESSATTHSPALPAPGRVADSA